MTIPYRMSISETLREQAEMVVTILLNEAVSFLEAQPLGSYLPIGAVNTAMAGLGAMFNLKAIQERMVARGCTRNVYIVKGGGGNPAGFIIISVEAHNAVQRVHGPRQSGADRPRNSAGPPFMPPQKRPGQ